MSASRGQAISDRNPVPDNNAVGLFDSELCESRVKNSLCNSVILSASLCNYLINNTELHKGATEVHREKNV